MILTRPIDLSIACLLRMTFLVGTIFSIFLTPQQLTSKQWIAEPIRQKKENKTKSVTKTTKTMRKSAVRPLSPKIKSAEREYHGPINAACLRHRMDPALVKAVILVESGFDPTAVSEKGAVGLMQLMPHVIDAFGVKDAFNPIHNINGGVKYLSQLLGYFGGDVYMGLAAYNAGIGRIGQARTIPTATHEFVQKVLSYYDYYQIGHEDMSDRI